jgi:hypothetical protein
MKLLASALAGRSIDVVGVDHGEPSWTDGTRIFVDRSSSHRDQIRAVAVQAALLAEGSLAPAVMAALIRKDPLNRRYLAIEGSRALAAQEQLLPPIVGATIDRSIVSRTDGPESSLALAQAKDPIAPAPAMFGVIRPRLVRFDTTSDSHEQTGRRVPRHMRSEAMAELDDAEDDESALSSDSVNPVGGGGAVGRLLQRFLGSSRSRGGGNPGAETPTHRTGRGSHRGSRARSSATAPISDDAAFFGRSGAIYPEWNVYDRSYRSGWCTVAEVAPEARTHDAVDAPDTTALRRALARLGMDLERRHRQPQGDDIDIDALVEARVDLLAGSAPDETVYVDSLRQRRDLSVLVLLDVSGSSGEPSVTGGTVHEQQRRAAADLTFAISELGDRVALYGFRSQGRSFVQVLPLKRFNDAADAGVLRRLGELSPGAYTRLGAAIRHGASILETDGGTARRLLVVLSDGFAYDHGYEGVYGEADARRALSEARRRGTACVCLSIGARTDLEDLRRVFGTAAHASIPNAEQLTTTVGPLFRSALRLTSAQRRTFQRRERTRERLRIERKSA